MNIFIYFNIFINLFDIFKKNNIEDNNIESDIENNIKNENFICKSFENDIESDIENNIKNEHFRSSPFEINPYSSNYVIVTDLENNYKIVNKH